MTYIEYALSLISRANRSLETHKGPMAREISTELGGLGRLDSAGAHSSHNI